MSARVLVVDDSLTTQEMLGIHLRKAGYTVKNAKDGAEAVEIARQWNPSLILLDVMMPIMDGFHATRKIREFSSIPIIILSAKGTELDRVQGLNAGADDYIVKPFSSVELMARLRALLRRSKSANGDRIHHKIFQHGNLLIDVERERVSVSGDEIDLTDTEFRLLVALAVSRGRAVKSKHLLTMIWGEKYESAVSILEGTIRRLRAKIELDPSKPIHILTCENKGYMIPMS
jgi:DNA-binding response OmpR family regulator